MTKKLLKLLSLGLLLARAGHDQYAPMPQYIKEAMLAIVQGCPALVAEVANGKLGHNELVQLMRRYIACPSAPAAGSN